MRKIITLFAVACSVLLSGCATTFSSQVSVFHEWPGGNQDKSYIFERTPGQENNLEHKHYEELLRPRLLNLGFHEITAGATPSLKIGMQYATTLREIQYSPLWRPAIYDPFWNLHFSRGVYRSRVIYPYYPGWGYYPRGMLDVSIKSNYLHQLSISIADINSGKKLADIKVSSDQPGSELVDYMPYLMDSALKEFPGNNGTTTKVELKIGK